MWRLKNTDRWIALTMPIIQDGKWYRYRKITRPDQKYLCFFCGEYLPGEESMTQIFSEPRKIAVHFCVDHFPDDIEFWGKENE
jgi:hypothetical protein